MIEQFDSSLPGGRDRDRVDQTGMPLPPADGDMGFLEPVVEGAKQLGVKVPLVVRLEGTNVELSKKMLAESGLNIVSADGMADAAEKIVKAVNG